MLDFNLNKGMSQFYYQSNTWLHISILEWIHNIYVSRYIFRDS